MKAPPLGPGGEYITWPDQMAPRGRKASSTRNVKPQTSNPRKRRENGASLWTIANLMRLPCRTHTPSPSLKMC